MVNLDEIVRGETEPRGWYNGGKDVDETESCCVHGKNVEEAESGVCAGYGRGRGRLSQEMGPVEWGRCVGTARAPWREGVCCRRPPVRPKGSDEYV